MSANVDSDDRVGYGFRELNSDEYQTYCVNNTSSESTDPPVLADSTNFTSLLSQTIWKRVYATGCYYINDTSLSYSSYGLEVLSDSNSTSTHCVSSHLTEFAGGMVVLPNSIDFENVWANASFTKNMTIYLTVIIICSLYILLFIVCRYKDWRDETKREIYLLNDNNPWDQYFYELIVFTGGRPNANTNSNVSFILVGDVSDTLNRQLLPKNAPKHHKILQRSSVDSFIMAVDG